MIPLLHALQIIETIRTIRGDWDAFHQVGPGEMEEESATPLQDARLSIASGGTLKAAYREGGASHELTGSIALSHFRYKEIIRWNKQDVDGDDLYLASHLLEEENRRVIVDFNFTQEGVKHRFRFRKSLDV